MLGWLFRWFSPRGPLDLAAKMAIMLAVIVVTNVGFAELYLGHQPVSLDYFIVKAAVVWAPWLALFFVINLHQDRAQRKLERLNRTDDLTGMLNRRTFLDLLQQAQTADRGGVLLMLDADHFKAINDEYGHVAGDDCLVAISQALRRSLRLGDVLGRLGGEEFAIILQHTSLDTARAMATRLTQPVGVPASSLHPAFEVTLSVGATAIVADVPIAKLLMRADKGLYAAKDAGRACLKVWEDLKASGDPALASGSSAA